MATRVLSIGLLTAFSLLAGASTAVAATIGFSFSGTVTTSHPALVSGIPVGTAFSGSGSVTVGPDIASSTDIGVFVLTGPNSFEASLGSNTITGAEAGSLAAFELGVNDGFTLRLLDFLGGTSVNGYTPFLVQIVMSGTNIANPNVLAIPPFSSDNAFFVTYQNAFGFDATVSGSLTSLEEITGGISSVPEPSTVALLSIGLVGAAGVRYRRRR